MCAIILNENRIIPKFDVIIQASYKGGRVKWSPIEGENLWEIIFKILSCCKSELNDELRLAKVQVLAANEQKDPHTYMHADMEINLLW